MRFPTTIREWLLPASVSGVTKPKIHHFRREAEGKYIRYHLRIDPDGPAILIAGASDALLLSPEGAVVAQAILSGSTAESVRHRLEISNPDELIEQVQEALSEFGTDNNRYPIFNLVDPAVVGQRLALVAPFQADLLVANTEKLIPIIEQLWDAGIPHVRLLLHDNDNDIRQDIVRAVTHAEDMGMIAGVRARAEQLAANAFLIELAEAGLDYVVLPWGITPEFHAAVFGQADYDQLDNVIRDILRWEMTPVLDAAMHPTMETHFLTALDVVENWNVHNVEVFAIADADQTSLESTATFYPPQSLRQVASWVEDVADQRLERLIWLPTVGRCEEEDLPSIVRRGPRAGGDVAIRVLSNGDVIPPRGPFRRAGNLLAQSWDKIWEDAAFDHYRTRVELPTHCEQCPMMSICAADCPAEVRSWSTGDLQNHES